MMYQIIWDEKAQEQLLKLDSTLSKRISKKVLELSENPFSKDVKKLKGIFGYRLRVGDYRVIFDVEKDVILILKIGHRKNIYN
ncbi:MAG: type II toxin-antitoxin system RelE/ParE family toxin [Nanoarchaeota archaeon]